MNAIDPITFREKFQNPDNFILIDVREPWEHELFNIGGLLIPMTSVFNNLDKIPQINLSYSIARKGSGAPLSFSACSKSSLTIIF